MPIADAERSDPLARRHVLCAALIAVSAGAIAANRGVYSASFSDASGYVAHAEQWRDGTLFRTVPLQFLPSLPTNTNTSAVGYQSGPQRGTEVPNYPVGYPLLMAAALAAGGELAGHLVAPGLLAALILVAFFLTRAFGGAGAGHGAALALACTPVTLMHGVTAMSDVPAAACWAGAWYFALAPMRSSACAAGALVALAVMVRPNLLPLAVVPGLLVMTGDGVSRQRWMRAVLFAAMASIGLLVVAASQYVLYGDPMQPGHRGWELLFRASHVPVALTIYPRLFVGTYGWLPVIGAAVAVVLIPGLAAPRRRIAMSACGLIVANATVYVAYQPYDDWPFLRFFLPATVAVFVLAFGALGVVGERLRRPLTRRAGACALLLAALAVGWHGRAKTRIALELWKDHASIPVMGHYLRDVLPRNAVVVSYLHSGAIRHYTGRDVVTPESLGPPQMDPLVRELERHGFVPVFVVDERLEQGEFRRRFPESAFTPFDWPPRAEFVANGRIRYFVAADRARHLAGERWVTDVLR